MSADSADEQFLLNRFGYNSTAKQKAIV